MKNGVVLQFVKSDKKVKFKEIQDGQFFFSDNTLYKRILSQDLDYFSIEGVNCVSLVLGGLTKFNDDEMVNLAE